MAIDLHVSNELQWVREGRVFFSQHGNLTTPQAFETDLVRKTADFAVQVPSGTVIVPLRVTVETEATANVLQCLIWTCNNALGYANHTENVPANINTRYSSVGSKCRSTYLTTSTGFAVTPTGVVDLHRVYIQCTIDGINEQATFEQIVYSPAHGKGAPCIVGTDGGDCGFLVAVGESTGTGYIQATWAEWDYDEFYAE